MMKNKIGEKIGRRRKIIELFFLYIEMLLLYLELEKKFVE